MAMIKTRPTAPGLPYSPLGPTSPSFAGVGVPMAPRMAGAGVVGAPGLPSFTSDNPAPAIPAPGSARRGHNVAPPSAEPLPFSGAPSAPSTAFSTTPAPTSAPGMYNFAPTTQPTTQPSPTFPMPASSPNTAFISSTPRPGRSQAAAMFPMAPGEQTVLAPTTPANRAQAFQRSLNLERANTADSAATFARNSPLPVDENGEYNGAFGKDPDAMQRAMGARKAYIDRQEKTSAAQNFGAGQNFEENKQYRQDWNTRANADSAGDNGFTAKDLALMSKADRDAAVAYKIRQMTPGAVEQQGAGIGLTRTRADALKADQARKAAYNPDLTRMTRDNAHDIVTAAITAHRDLTTQLNTARRVLASPGLDPDIADSVQKHITNLVTEERAARTGVDRAVKRAEDLRNSVVRPTAGARPTTQPATQPGNGSTLTHEDAASILQEAGGDKNRARQIAQSRGYSF